VYGDRAKVVLGAAWSKRTNLKLSREAGAGRDWAIQVVEGEEGVVSAWDIPTLLEMAGETQIDLLKCDIERSELEIFGPTASHWIKGVKNICIELHGPDCERVFRSALEDFDFETEVSGELTICRSLKPRATWTMDGAIQHELLGGEQ
jgi:hypothetical protein